MNPVLIYKNTDAIATAKSALELNLELFQDVYSAIKAIGITPTIAEIDGLLGQTARAAAPGFETEYAVNKLLDAAAPYNLNGVQLQRNRVKEMIVPPNVTGLKAALAGVSQLPEGAARDTTLLVIVNDAIVKVPDADAQIEARYTHYTKTDAGAAMASSLQAVCDALNNFDAANDKRIFRGLTHEINEFERTYGRSTKNPLKNAINGLEIRGGQFAVSLSFINAFERV